MTVAQAIREAGTVAGEAEKVTSEVSVKARRRRHSASYKLGILKKAEAAREEPGKVGELLRREGLYSSHLTEWRRLQERGALQELGPKRRGPVPKVVDARIVELERENARLKARVEVAEALIEVQKKVSVMLGIELGPKGPDGSGRKR